MPRISLWSQKKTHDYHFFDKNIREQFYVGGTTAIIHKYIGTTETEDETDIQDIILLENRDRKYEKDMFELRGIYPVADNDFDLTVFNQFLTNDILYMTFHLNEMVEIMGRKLINGDVIELPHLLEDYALTADIPPLPKFYVVQDGNRAAEGFSATWYPHIWRVKLGPIQDAQEFGDILYNKPHHSTTAVEMDIANQVVTTAQEDDPVGGPETMISHLYNFETDRKPSIGHAFPSNPKEGDFFVRSDFTPKRMFQYKNNKWIRVYDNIEDRLWSTHTFNASKQLNNDEIFDGEPSKQSISDVVSTRTRQ